jgi:hypothetical protein
MITNPLSFEAGKSRKFGWIACGLLLVAHGTLAVDAARQHNITMDEGGHLLSGLIAWEYGRVDVYPVNPPLIKLIASFPWCLTQTKLPEDLPYTPSLRWSEQENQFVRANQNHYQDLTVRARCTVVVLSILGGILIYRWSSQLFGTAAGLVGLALWSFCPNVLTWAGVATVDLGATVFGLAAMYALRHYFRYPDWFAALWTGLILGLALLTKFTLLVLYPVFVLLGAAAWRQSRSSPSSPGVVIRLLHLALIFFISIFVIDAGYGFRGVGRQLGSFSFRCHALTREDNGIRTNRFRNTWLGHLPIPLPAVFLTGLDKQKSDDDANLPAYLRGQWQKGGWWYYYLYGLAVKLPLGTLVLIVLCGMLALCGSRYRASVINELLLWLPAGSILLLISSQTGINSHLRYVLPMFPFFFVGISRVGLLLVDFGNRLGWRPRTPLLGAALVVAALGWNISAAVRIHPHYLSYFNELAGGPENGWRHLLDSNIDWGQDLLFLKRWTEAHPEARPLHLAYDGGIDPHLLGFEYQAAPLGYSLARTSLSPGWYAVSVNFVYGPAWTDHDESGHQIPFGSGPYNYFSYFAPVDKAGYSLFIYHITLEDADRVRIRRGEP